MDSTGTIQQFKDKLADIEFQDTLNISIEYTKESSQFGPYTNGSSPDRVTVMNDLSNQIPSQLTEVLVKGEYEGADVFALYEVNAADDKVEVKEDGGPVQTKPIIFF